MNPLQSPCCNAIITDEEWSAHCTLCNATIQWAFANERWARREACGVFTGVDNKKYFAWQSVSNMKHAKELIESIHNTFVCFHKGCVSTISCYWDKDADMISDSNHKSFIRKWMSQVENPEVGAVIFDND